jgi:hypothetical protein
MTTATTAAPKPKKTLDEQVLDVEWARHKARRTIAAETQGQLPPLVSLSVKELYAQPSSDYLVDGLLPERALAELIGDSESLKSFFAIHLGLSIATKQPHFFAQKIIGHGPVVYIAAEGASAFQYRLRAWATQLQVDILDAPFYTVPVPVNLRDEKFQKTFCELLQRIQPVLVIVDTLHRCAPGAEENNSRDIGEVVAFAQKLQFEFRTAVLFLHHPPKSDPRGRGRGSSALYYAADTEISAVVKGEENEDGTKVVEFTVRKQKDDVKLKLTLANRIVPLHDENDRPLAYKSGRAICSCVLVQATDEEVKHAAREDSLDGKVVAYVRAHPDTVRTTVAKSVEGKESDIQLAIDRLLETGILASQPNPRGRGNVLSLVTERGLLRVGAM